MSAPVRLGLIGVGRWGRVLLRNLQAHPEVALTWVASRNPDTRELVGTGVTVTSDWRTFATAGLDGVVIATPVPLHAEMVLAAIEAGVPAFVEKPLTDDTAAARLIQERAEEARVPVLVDHVHLFHPAFEPLQAAVARDGGARWILTCGGQYGRRGGDVGVLWDYGPHDVSLALALLGLHPTLVEASREAVPGGLETIRLGLRWPDGIQGSLEFGNAMRRKQRWVAVGTETAVYLLDDLATLPLTRHAPRPGPARPEGHGTPVTVDVGGTPVERALHAFVAAIRGNDDPGRLVLAVEVVRILETANRAIAEPGR